MSTIDYSSLEMNKCNKECKKVMRMMNQIDGHKGRISLKMKIREG